jgi:hypothetical protein
MTKTLSEADTAQDVSGDLKRLVQRAMDNAGTMPAKDAVKLRPSDWRAICDHALRTPHGLPGEVLAKFARIGRDMEMRLLTQKSDVPGLSPQDYTEVTTELGHAADAVLRAELNERAPGTLPPLKEGERRIEELWALDALTIQDWIDLSRLTASRTE